jgi:hypothetical protein
VQLHAVAHGCIALCMTLFYNPRTNSPFFFVRSFATLTLLQHESYSGGHCIPIFQLFFFFEIEAMWYDDASPSCGATQCHPLAPQSPPPPQWNQPLPVALATPYIDGSGDVPTNPLCMVQGQVLQQDLQRPPSEIYGEGAVYGHPHNHGNTSSSVYPSCHTPNEHPASSEGCIPVAETRAKTPQLHRALQVVRYGQASSDNPDSYLRNNYKPTVSPPAAPVVGMVRYGGTQPAPPTPVTYGQIAAPGGPIYTLPSSSQPYSAAPPLQTAANVGSGAAPIYGQYSAAPPFRSHSPAARWYSE